MTTDLRAAGDACWNAFTSADWGRAIGTCKATPIARDAIYIATQGVVGNVTALKTGAGLVVFDTGGIASAQLIYDTLRAFDQSPIGDRFRTALRCERPSNVERPFCCSVMHKWQSK